MEVLKSLSYREISSMMLAANLVSAIFMLIHAFENFGELWFYTGVAIAISNLTICFLHYNYLKQTTKGKNYD